MINEALRDSLAKMREWAGPRGRGTYEPAPGQFCALGLLHHLKYPEDLVNNSMRACYAEYGISREQAQKIVRLNDDNPYLTWPQIADRIEQLMK